uniref:WD repeat-containing protein 89 n=1 Tax=Schistocephalus solidus TaxID=70667 RepID=A0A0X3PJ76_SCHSO
MFRCSHKCYFKDHAFLAAIHSVESILAASDDHFVLLDIKTLRQSVHRRSTPGRLVSVDAAPFTNRFISCTESGVVSLLDLQSKNCEVISSRPGSENLPRPTSFTCCAIDPKSRYLCAGTDSVDDHSLSKKRQKLDGDEPRAHILVWDIRRLTEPLSVFSDIHSDCITHLSFDDTSRLLSSSEDGLVCFSDIGASPDDALLQVFNAEAPINYCGWLSPDKAADSGVYSLSNMRLKFQCWPWVPPEAEVTTTVDEVWRKLKRTYHDKTLLSAVRLPDTFARLSAEREIPEWPEYPVICMLSTADDRYNLRVSLLRPGTSTYLASHAMQSKTTDTKSDIFYAAFLDSEPRHILAVGRHSVHHLRLNISGEL